MIGLVPLVGMAKIRSVNKLALEGGPKLLSTNFYDFIYKCHVWI